MAPEAYRRPGRLKIFSGRGAFFSTALVVGGAILASAPTAHALTFRITNRTTTLSGAQATAVNAVADSLERIFNNTLFPSGYDTDFLKAMANASAASGRGALVDTASAFDTLSITALGSGAISSPATDRGGGTQPAQNRLPGLGLALQTGVIVGMPARSLGISRLLGMESNRLKLFGSFSTLKLNQLISGVGIEFFGIGAGLRYALVPESRYGLIGSWMGVSLSSGLQFTQTSIRYRTPLSAGTSDGTYTVTYSTSADLGIQSSVITVPTMVTSGFRFVEFLALYGGLGLDVNAGKSQTSGQIVSDAVGRDGSNAVVFGGTGTLDANSTENTSPSFLSLRGLLGLQFEFWAVKLFTEVHLQSPRTTAATLGLRAAW